MELSTGHLNHEFLILSDAGAFVRHQLNGDCVFLKDKQCQVASCRPASCRLFPLTKTTAPGEAPGFQLIQTSLPLEKDRPRSLVQFLSEQDARPAMELADRYTDLFMALAEKLMGENPDQETHDSGFESDISSYTTVQLMYLLLDGALVSVLLDGALVFLLLNGALVSLLLNGALRSLCLDGAFLSMLLNGALLSLWLSGALVSLLLNEALLVH